MTSLSFQNYREHVYDQLRSYKTLTYTLNLLEQ